MLFTIEEPNWYAQLQTRISMCFRKSQLICLRLKVWYSSSLYLDICTKYVYSSIICWFSKLKFLYANLDKSVFWARWVWNRVGPQQFRPWSNIYDQQSLVIGLNNQINSVVFTSFLLVLWLYIFWLYHLILLGAV